MIARRPPETLREYLQEYATTREIDAGTLRQYGISVGKLEQWAGHPFRLDELDELTISTWLRDYSQTVASSTVRSKRNQVLALWRSAADDGYVEPPRRRIRSARCVVDAPTAWTIDEVAALRDACHGLKRRHRCGLPRSIWWELAVLVAWDTGLRWGDLTRLKVSAIPPHGVFAVTQHKTRRVAICHLEDATHELLRRSLELCPRELVCPWPASGETFRTQARRLVARAGIRAGTWKWLRRSSGTDVEIQQFGAAARQLGHGPGSRVAYVSYVDPVQVAQHGRNVWPRPLPLPAPRG
jgi:integrase